MNIFIESHYPTVLKKMVDERKNLDSKFTFQAIAEKTKIPKSYISKVVNGRAHFNADQLFLVCQHLDFDERQTRYMLLLLEIDRCCVKSRRDSLQNEIQAFREMMLDSKNHLKANSDSLPAEVLRDYYSDPINQIVHISLTIPQFQSDLRRLASDLSISPDELGEIITRIERMGLIEQKNHKIRPIIDNVHLPKTSPTYKPWRNQLKLMCLERLNRRSHRHDYSFSVTFSASEKSREKIHAEFLQFLKQTETIVAGSKRETTYQLNFDLFPWTI